MTVLTSIPRTKKWYQKKWIYFVGFFLLLIGGAVFAYSRNTVKESVYEIVPVERGVLTQTVDASGNIQSADELDLRFESSGRISHVYAQVNQQIKKGELLADLDLGELNARIEQSSASLVQAQANLLQIKATTADSIANAEATLQKAELNLKLSEGGTDSQIIRDVYNDAVALIFATQATISEALTESDNIIGVDNGLANDAYQSSLSVQSPTTLDTAKTRYVRASEDLSTLNLKVNTLSVSSMKDDIDNALSLTEKSLNSTKELLFYVSEVLNFTSPGILSASDLNTLKSTISAQRTAVNTKYTSLISQRQAILNAKNSYATYTIAYEQAKQNLENARNKAVADVAAYEASINASRASLSVSAATRNKSRIIAPIGGTVAKVAFKPGEFVTSQDVIIKLVSPRFEVKVDIPETDIIKISTGVSTTVTLDAFGSDIKFTGVVTQIESGETVIQDVVYYKVTVVLEDNPGFQVLNGMTADVVFYTEKKDAVLSIPQRAIRTENNKKLVRVLENGQPKDVEVVTGLRGDDGLIEIVSGLEEGQEVVVREKS